MSCATSVRLGSQVKKFFFYTYNGNTEIPRVVRIRIVRILVHILVCILVRVFSKLVRIRILQTFI